MAGQKRLSDEAVTKATGKTVAEWVKVIDDLGGEKMSHKEIVKALAEKKLIESVWWQQSVTVEYEYAKGRRTLGETAASGFEVGVNKTVQRSQADVWAFLTSSEGLELWLGKGAKLRLEPGQKYETATAKGEIRTMKSGERIRLTYQREGAAAPAILQLTIAQRTPTSGTGITAHMEKLSSADEREEMRKHWQEVLGEIAKRLAA